MMTWCLSNWWQKFLLLALVAINLNNCEPSPTSISRTKNIDQNLRVLRESLRWVRSPTPATRFRPWGGKRQILLCLTPSQIFDLRVQSKCQSFSGKGDTDSENDTPPSSDNKDITNYLPTQAIVPLFERGMPETVNEEQSLENGSSKYFDLYTPSYSKTKKNMLLPATSDENSNEKKHTFYPWAGKRDKIFYPWAGKRSSIFELDRTDHELNNTIENSIEVKLQEPFTSDYNLLNSHRDKREVMEDIYIPTATDFHPSKRSTLQFWKESTKRIGILSDLLKEFENVKGSSVPRGFHPWAGKKRSETELYIPTRLPNYFVPFVPSLISHDTKTENLYISKDNLKQFLANKRRSFHPWAGKRAVGEQDLDK